MRAQPKFELDPLLLQLIAPNALLTQCAFSPRMLRSLLFLTASKHQLAPVGCAPRTETPRGKGQSPPKCHAPQPRSELEARRPRSRLGFRMYFDIEKGQFQGEAPLPG